MKKINLIIDAVSLVNFIEDYNRIRSILISEEKIHLETKINFANTSNTEIRKIVDYLSKMKIFEDIYEDNVYTFIFSIRSEKESIRAVRKLNSNITRIELNYNEADFENIVPEIKKRKLPYIISINTKDFEQAICVYDKIKVYGIPVYSDVNIEYGKDYLELLLKWLYDKKGCHFNIYDNLIYAILLEYWGTQCKYKSCLSKYYYINDNRILYCCCKSEIEIGKIQDINTVDDINNKSSFRNILLQAIEKRDSCKLNCEYYEFCQGGCPNSIITSINECANKKIFSLIPKIEEIIKHIINEVDYSEINPALREMILLSVASNKMFVKGLFE